MSSMFDHDSHLGLNKLTADGSSVSDRWVDRFLSGGNRGEMEVRSDHSMLSCSLARVCANWKGHGVMSRIHLLAHHCDGTRFCVSCTATGFRQRSVLVDR